jgi:hypothetical protein
MFDDQIVYTDAKVSFVVVGNLYDTATKKNMTGREDARALARRFRQPAARSRDEEGQGQRVAAARDLSPTPTARSARGSRTSSRASTT